MLNINIKLLLKEQKKNVDWITYYMKFQEYNLLFNNNLEIKFFNRVIKWEENCPITIWIIKTAKSQID